MMRLGEKKNRTEYPITVGQLQKTQHTHNGNARRKKGTEEICKEIMTQNVPQINVRHKPQIEESQRTPSKINTPLKKIFLKTTNIYFLVSHNLNII